MKQVFLSTTTEFKEIDTLEAGTWINMVNPSQSESIEIANAFNINIADIARVMHGVGCPVVGVIGDAGFFIGGHGLAFHHPFNGGFSVYDVVVGKQ